MKNTILIALTISLAACQVQTDSATQAQKSAATEDAPTNAELMGLPSVKDMPEDTVCFYFAYNMPYGDGNMSVSIGRHDTFTESEDPLTIGVGVDGECFDPMPGFQIQAIENMMAEQGFANQVEITCEKNTTGEIYPGGYRIKTSKLSVKFLNPAMKYGGVCGVN